VRDIIFHKIKSVNFKKKNSCFKAMALIANAHPTKWRETLPYFGSKK